MAELPSDSAGNGTPRFLVDAMLGRLATWLRILGYDAEYFRGGDEELLRLAWQDERVVLTRDTVLLRRRRLPPHLLVKSDRVEDQLRQVLAALHLRPPAAPGRRCVRCNVPLAPCARSEVRDVVPDFVWTSHDTFWACPRCRRVYWPGTHCRHMADAIRRLR